MFERKIPSCCKNPTTQPFCPDMKQGPIFPPWSSNTVERGRGRQSRLNFDRQKVTTHITSCRRSVFGAGDGGWAETPCKGYKGRSFAKPQPSSSKAYDLLAYDSGVSLDGVWNACLFFVTPFSTSGTASTVRTAHLSWAGLFRASLHRKTIDKSQLSRRSDFVQSGLKHPAHWNCLWGRVGRVFLVGQWNCSNHRRTSQGLPWESVVGVPGETFDIHMAGFGRARWHTGSAKWWLFYSMVHVREVCIMQLLHLCLRVIAIESIAGCTITRFYGGKDMLHLIV